MERVQQPRHSTEIAVTLEDPVTGAIVHAAPATPCVSAGPKYRARERDGLLTTTEIERADLVTLADTVLGAMVYVPDHSNGKLPKVFRLRRVIGGRPNRVAGAPD